MRKLAIFVEGYTEVLFLEKLIEEIAGKNNVAIKQIKIRGGKNVGRTTSQIKAVKAGTAQRYYVLLVDCGGDKLVKTRIREEHQNLTNSGYTIIIGVRDVRPDFTHADIPRLEQGLRTRIKTSLIPVVFILSVMEIEAWFLSEFNHFPRIDPSITVALIVANLGFDPQTEDMTLRSTPAVDLNSCYQIGNKTYEKSNPVPTINALDYPFLYVELQNKISHLKRLTDTIDAFLA